MAAIALTAASTPACSGNSQGSSHSSSAGGHGAGSGDGGNIFDPDAGPGSGQGGSSGTMIQPDAACAAEKVKAELIPVNMLILFDRSASMGYKSKFPQATAALTSFFQNPASAGLRVALRFFPDMACNQQTCDTAACTPPTVPLGTLQATSAPADKQEDALVTAVAGTMLDVSEFYQLGGTPLSAALDGAEHWATAYRAAHATEKVAVVLVSDGEPHGCDPNYPTLNDLAAKANAAGVLTYVVGLAGFFESQMNAIAQNGGTGQASFIGMQDVEGDLLKALQAIQKGTVTCDIPMPMSQNGMMIDLGQVNVNYTPSGGMSTLLPEVDNAAACTAKGGWYYDDPKMPTKISLCPATCDAAQADVDPTIDILLGCMDSIH